MTSLVHYEKAKRFMSELRSYLKKQNVSDFEIKVLEENLNAYIGTSNTLRSIGLDAYNNVWVTATNFGESYLIKSFVVLFKSNNGSYTDIRGYSDNIITLHDKMKVFYS